MSYEEIELNDVVAVDEIQEVEEESMEPPELPSRGSGHRRRALQRDMERRLPSLNAPSDREIMIPPPVQPQFCNINDHYWARSENCEIAKIMCLLFICIVLGLAIAFVAYCVNGVDKLLPNRVSIKKGCFFITCVGDEPVLHHNP